MFSQRAIIPWLEYQVLVVVRDDRTPMLPFIFRRELIRSAIVSNTAAGSAAARFFSFFLFRFHNPRAPNQPARQLYVFKGFYYCPEAAFDTDTRTFCCNDVAGLITAFVYQRSLPMFFCFHVASCTRLQHVFITCITPLLSTRISCMRSRFPLTKTHDSPPLPVHVRPKTHLSFEKKSIRCLYYKSHTEFSFERSHYPPRSRTPSEHRDGNSR